MEGRSKMEFDEQGRIKIPKMDSIENAGEKSERRDNGLVELNYLGEELSKKIEQLSKNLTCNLPYKDDKTMRSFYVEKIKHDNGLCWLEPKKNGSLLIHIKKQDYSSVDTDNLLQPGWGGYPTIEISSSSEIDYTLKLIEWAYKKWKEEKMKGGYKIK